MATSDLLLPPGAVLFHIGPYKTGTTSLQASLFAAREEIAAHGVYYPGKWRRAMREGWSLIQWTPHGRSAPDPIEYWERFAHDIRDHTGMRSCLSSEDLAATKPETIRKAVDDLGGDRVHVVMVLRRYDRLLPSAWQERVKGKDRRTYDQWLHEILLGDDKSQAHRAFWRAQGVARVAPNWLTAVAPERFHVIVTDDSDRGLLARTFEQMLGLPDGILVPQDIENASLSANAAELARRMNVHFEEEDWPPRLHFCAMYEGATRAMMHTPTSTGDLRIPPLPAWALEPLAELSEKRVQTIADLGLHVVGDPRQLLIPAGIATTEESAGFPETISLDQAEAALAAAIKGSLRFGRERAGDNDEQPDPTVGRRRVDDVTAGELARALAGRVVRRLRPRR